MRTVKLLMVLFFGVVICAAAIQYCLSVVNVKSVNENRTKEEWPQQNLWAGLSEGFGYAASVERFFSDHFPLRDFALRGLCQFEYSVLSRSREVIIGKDGWLSDRKVLTEQLHQLDRVNDEQIKFSVIQLKRLQHWLQNRGIDFLMVIVPMKPTIYAEKYPARYTQRPKQIALQRFQNALGKNNIPYLDVMSILNEHKNDNAVYYKTDMHWNTVGVYYVAEAIVNYFSRKILEKPIWNERMRKGEAIFFGQELATMPLLFPKPELAPTWTSANPGYKEMNEGGSTNVKAYTGVDKTLALLPPSIMFGNSFMLQYPAIGYHNYFSESYRVLDYQFFANVLSYIEPKHKIFIMQIYETQLLFHILPPDSFNYWDKRLQGLPLPEGFQYR